MSDNLATVPRYLFLQEVALEAGELVLPDHVTRGEGAKHLLEHDEHGGRPLPVGGHGVGHHRETVRRLASNSPEALFPLDHVRE